MKFVGTAAAAATVVGAGAGSAAAAEYTTITVAAGESKRITVGSDETLENLLIDITADGADARIEASGDNWVVRNVGFEGKCDIDKFDGFWNRLHVEGNGLVERVYLGDGAVSGINCGGAGCPSGHSGHVEVSKSYFAEWTDNGFYTAHAAENGGGTFHFHDCYFRDNNVAHLRIASDGTIAERCVIHNTGNVPYDDVVDSKGVYTGYGVPEQVVEIRDCDVEVTDENTNGTAYAFVSNDDWHAEMSTIEVYNTEYLGDVYGPYVDLVSGIGFSPVIEIPDGVPTSAEEAASGGTTVTTETTNTAPSASIVNPSDGATVSGTVTIQVDASDSEDDDTALAVEVSIDGGTYQTASYNSTSGYYEYDWDTTGVSDGDHTVDARATDSEGMTTDAGQITVTVDNDSSVAVSTVDATVVDSTTASMEGTLDDLGGASSADVYFEYREAGASNWNASATQTLSSTGSFAQEVSGLQSGTDYEFRSTAAASDGDTDTGSQQTFTTESDTDSPPTVERYEVTEAGSPNPHAEITVDWSVADDDGDLDDVGVQVADSSGSVVDTAHTNVSGNSASDVNKFKIKHVSGQTFEVTLTVTDQAGNSTSASRSVSEN